MSDVDRSPQGSSPPAGVSPSGTIDLERLREEILDCDQELVRILARRKELVREVGVLKARLGRQVTDPRREAIVVRRAATLARNAGVDEELVRNLIWQIMASARRQQYAPPTRSTLKPPNPKEG
ncbi:MAG: chorismate mutase [Gemmatimonadota bacterium]|nr:chorismate mutase [Gemmatimonadota bacterium]MDE2984168.1 chorismate mutase [Gemmatimonadota bacterium]